MVRVWDAANGAEVAVLSGFNDWVNEVVISPDSSQLLSVTRDNIVQMWDIPGRQVLFDLTMVDTDDRQLDITHALHYRPDGTPLVAVGNLAGEVRVFDMTGGGPAQRFQAHTEWVSAGTFSPDGQILATAGADNLVRLWNTQTWQEMASLSGHTDLISLLATSPDGQTLVSSSGLPGSEDPALRVWNVAAGNLLYSLSEHTDGVYAVAFSPNGTYLATAGWDDALRVYQVEGGLVRQNVPITNDSPANPVFSPTQPLLAYAEVDGTAALLNVDTGESRRLSSHEGPVEALAFSPDGRLLATADQSGTIYLWDVAGGLPLATLTGHHGVAFELAFSPDGTLLISGGLDGTIRLWGVQ
jgi:WD40 repeat protein